MKFKTIRPTPSLSTIQQLIFQINEIQQIYNIQKYDKTLTGDLINEISKNKKRKNYNNGFNVVLMGSTRMGNSVSLIITECPNFFYVKQSDLDNNKQVLDKIKHKIETLDKKLIYIYQQKNTTFCKIVIPNNGHQKRVIDKLKARNVKIYEPSRIISNQNKFSELTGIYASNILKLSTVHCGSSDTKTLTFSQLEYTISYDNFIKYYKTQESDNFYPQLLISFDVEAYSKSGFFPKAHNKEDKVTSIGSTVHLTNTNIYHNYVFALNDVYSMSDFKKKAKDLKEDDELKSKVNACLELENVTVYSFKNELNMLLCWRDFVVQQDPDILTGYNIINFDLSYLNARILHLKLGATRFNHMGRIIGTPINFNTEKKTLRVKSTSGRIIFDLWQYITQEYKLSSNKLNDVCMHFLGNSFQKIDLKVTEIFSFFKKNKFTRTIMNLYCVKDCILPLQLINKIDLLLRTFAQSKVTYTPFGSVLNGGTQIKTFNTLVKIAHDNGYLMNRNDLKNSNENSYEGAKVFEVGHNFYGVNDPVAALDFKSLYPSVMIKNNICYSTYIPPKLMTAELKNKCTAISVDDHTHHFMKDTILEGIVPKILKRFLAARQDTKRQMKNTRKQLLALKKVNGDPDKIKKLVFMEKLLDNKQLAYKIICNAVYGFTGVPSKIGKFPCVFLAASTTAMGRYYLLKAKEIAEQMKPYNLEIVYGDTDSIMIRNKNVTTNPTKNMFDIAHTVVKNVNNILNEGATKQIIILEFEKIFCPYLIIGKKKYIAKCFTTMSTFEQTYNPQNAKLDCTGFELNQRSFPEFGKIIVKKLIDILIMDSGTKTLVRTHNAFKYLVDVIVDIILFNIEIPDKITRFTFKNFSKSQNFKDASDYKTPDVIIPIQVIKRIKKRGIRLPPNPGQKINYVITWRSGKKKSDKVCDYAEYMDYVVEDHKKDNLKLDTVHYIDKVLKKPVVNIFLSFYKNIESVFTIFTNVAKLYLLSGQLKTKGQSYKNVTTSVRNHIIKQVRQQWGINREFIPKSLYVAIDQTWLKKIQNKRKINSNHPPNQKHLTKIRKIK